MAAVPPYEWSRFDWFCLWYPPGWLILLNRHWQHYHSDPDGWIWPEYLLFLIPGGFYLALLLRWLRLGCRLPQATDRPFDPTYQKALATEVLTVMVRRYFHAELHQVENLPQQGPLLIVMNHAGMCFPWDFLSLATLLAEVRGWTVQPLADISLFQHPWMRWWLPPDWSQVLGGVEAQAATFEEALARQPILLYAPEGLRGPRKGWGQRYQLQRFHSSFIRLSDRYRIPILPVICWGNESLHPWAWHWQALAKRLQMPFLPLSPLILVFILFPSMGVWAMPTKLRYFIQPLRPSQGEISIGAETKSSPGAQPQTIRRRAAQLREDLQTQINQDLRG